MRLSFLWSILACFAPAPLAFAQSIPPEAPAVTDKILSIASDDPSLDVVTVPVFLGKPHDLTRGSKDWIKAHEKYPTLRSCLTADETGLFQISSVFEWERYRSDEEVFICISAVATWAQSPDRLIETYAKAAPGGHSGKLSLDQNQGPNTIVSLYFDRNKYPGFNSIWTVFLAAVFLPYSVTKQNSSGISVSYTVEGSLYAVRRIAWGL